MDPKDFGELKQSVLDMKAHMRGEQVEGVRKTQVEVPDTAQVRQSMGLSQAQFAVLLDQRGGSLSPSGTSAPGTK